MTLAELTTSQPRPAIPTERSLLIVEDDKSFLQRLAKALEARGFAVTTAESVADVRGGWAKRPGASRGGPRGWRTKPIPLRSSGRQTSDGLVV